MNCRHTCTVLWMETVRGKAELNLNVHCIPKTWQQWGYWEGFVCIISSATVVLVICAWQVSLISMLSITGAKWKKKWWVHLSLKWLTSLLLEYMYLFGFSFFCMCSFSSFQEHINSCILEFLSQLLWEKVQSCNLIQI